MAVFSLTLKQSINCPRCLKSSLRYSIYKVQTRFRKEALGLYHTQNHLSRTFFDLFQTFSTGFSSLAALVSNSDILAQMLSFVKNFLHSLPNFFIFSLTPTLSRTACVYYHMLSCLSSIILQNSSSFFAFPHSKGRGLEGGPFLCCGETRKKMMNFVK